MVKQQSERPGGNFYNHAFYDYIARRYIGDSPAVKTLTTDQAKTPITNQEAAQAFLEYRDKGKLTWSNSNVINGDLPCHEILPRVFVPL